LVGLLHRALLLALHHVALDALAEANHDWYTGQQLPIEMLRDQLLRSLVLLQQTPPVPNFLMGIVLKHFDWPAGVTEALVSMQGLFSIASAVVMTHILLALFPGRSVLAAAAGVAFVLNTDLVVIEYNSLGQTFYEIVSMFIAICLAAAMLSLYRNGRGRDSFAAGLLVALLALTRATWSFFALPGLALLLWLVRSGRLRHAALFLAPGLVLHGGWAVKNWAVYGVFSPTTATWTGWNLVNGLRGVGFSNRLRDFVASRPDLSCFAADPSKGPPLLDPRLSDRDRAIEARVGIENTRLNTLEMRAALDDCARTFWQFAAHAPRAVAAKTYKAYQLFWTPPANYGRFFLGFFAVENRLDRGLSPARIVELMLDGTLPDQPLERSGKYPKRTFTPTTLYTPRWLEPLWLLANLIGVHVLLPLALLAAALLRRRTATVAVLLVCAVAYAYLALTSSVADYGENMRFRIGVEPLIWLITILSASELVFMARTFASARVRG
jgi:hypothetical protein